MPVPSTWSPWLLSVLRIAAGLAFLQHGVSKYFGIPPFPMPFSALPPILLAAGAIELVAGTLIVLGLFTRPAAFIASGMSAVGYFLMHAPQSFFPAVNGGEAIMLFTFIFLFLSAAGGGSFSLDTARARNAG